MRRSQVKGAGRQSTTTFRSLNGTVELLHYSLELIRVIEEVAAVVLGARIQPECRAKH